LNRLPEQVDYTETLIPPQNWNLEWEKQFEPVWLTDKCLIRAPFHEPAAGNCIQLIIEPKMSFGTGHHPTTRLMCKALFLLPLQGKTVLDMGCGTGILAILAAKLGAESVWGIDTEQWAIENSIENAERNDVAAQFSLGAEDRIGGKTVDVFLANINRNVLIANSEPYSSAVKPEGYLLLSGFLEPDVEAIQAKYANLGFEQVDLQAEDNWRCLILRKLKAEW
jgi:ribosomal protein L11 methyltransferase